MKNNKVVIVGTGMVGSSYGYSLINQGIVDELVLIDLNEKNAIANANDMVHCIGYLDVQPKIYAGKYSDCKDADVVCITAGAAQKPGQSRLELVGINTKIMEGIVDEIMASGFNGIILVASNPVDVMALVAQVRSGLPKERVIGSGTTLDTGRLRSNISHYMGYNTKNIHAYIIGEHGDSSLPIWSTATIGQKPLLDIVKESNGKYTQEGLDNCFIEARDAAYKIIEGKGSTYYGIGIALANVTKSILRGSDLILPISCKLEGEYNQDGLYIPVPAMVGENGLKEIQILDLNEKEIEMFNNSCTEIKSVIKSIGYDNK